MKFLARDPIPIFLGDAGIGQNHGPRPAQLSDFDVYYDVPPPVALHVTVAVQDEVILEAIAPVEDTPEVSFVPGEPYEDSSSLVEVVATPEPLVGIFEVVYEEDL